MDNSIVLHPEMSMLDAFHLAQETGQYLVTNGKDVEICPAIMPGWREVAIRIRQKQPAPLTA